MIGGIGARMIVIHRKSEGRHLIRVLEVGVRIVQDRDLTVLKVSLTTVTEPHFRTVNRMKEVGSAESIVFISDLTSLTNALDMVRSGRTLGLRRPCLSRGGWLMT